MSPPNDSRPGDVSTAEATSKSDASRTDDQYNPPGYPLAARIYRAAGWRGVLPLPPRTKFPPPKGFTGHDGVWPDDDQVKAWVESQSADANLMLRVDYGVIGIDVDDYDLKTGGQTLKEAESRWGPLPPTHRSTARREDIVSGIRLFRVPEGVLFRGVITFADLDIGDIEIVQPHHRYIVAWPSINPKTSQRYRWYGPDGSLLPEGVVPLVDDVPELPTRWVSALSRDAVRHTTFDGSAPNRTGQAREQINEDIYQRLIGLAGNDEPDRVVAARLERAVADLTGSTGCRYDTTRDHVAALMRLQAIGRVGVPAALRQLYAAYVLDVADTRPRVVAEAEFLRFTEGAAALVAASVPEHTRHQAEGDSDTDSAAHHAGWTLTDGAGFILDIPDTIPALWGEGQRVLWAEGESLMICGPMGVGKTTLAGMLLHAQLGGMGDVDEQVLGLPVAQIPGKILYLAMDRPKQIARSLHRQFSDARRKVLRERLVVWQGPPPADIAANPHLLVELAERAEASVVYLDSIKDAAVGLSEDAVGAGYNRARQHLVNKGVQMLELHHTKKQGDGTVNDVYGSTWLGSGTGSIILLSGQPGDPVVGLRHIRQPAAEVGPLVLTHDEAKGAMTVVSGTDPMAVITAAGEGGCTAKDLAVAMFETDDPDRNQIEKARRQLDRLVGEGTASRAQGTRGGAEGGTATRWFPA